MLSARRPRSTSLRLQRGSDKYAFERVMFGLAEVLISA